jgi:glyoxylase-like metal-dependent hydrolase (beta-lactamase superfamily II)
MPIKSRRFKYFVLVLTLALTLPCATLHSAQKTRQSYKIEKVAEGVYAALAIPGSAATSNAFIVDLGYYLVAGGAHLTKEAINDLLAAAANISPKPVETFVLAHHHKGFSFVDFDFPPDKNIIMSLQTRQAMKQEVRKINGPINYFREGLTLEGTERSLVLTNIGPAHSSGDLIAYVPQSKTLFTSDLVYIDCAGFLGDGPLREWVLALEGISTLDAERVIPGYGPTSGMEDVVVFKNYLKEFLTEVIQHIEKGDNLYETLKSFSMPKYADRPGYQTFSSGNIERAYRQLSDTDD